MAVFLLDSLFVGIVYFHYLGIYTFLGIAQY